MHYNLPFLPHAKPSQMLVLIVSNRFLVAHLTTSSHTGITSRDYLAAEAEWADRAWKAALPFPGVS